MDTIWTLTALHSTSFHSTSLHAERDDAIKEIRDILETEGFDKEDIETWIKVHGNNDEIWIEETRFEFFISFHQPPVRRATTPSNEIAPQNFTEGQTVVYIRENPQQSRNPYIYIVPGSKGTITSIIDGNQYLVDFENAGIFTMLPEELSPDSASPDKGQIVPNNRYALLCIDSEGQQSSSFQVIIPDDMSPEVAGAKAYIHYLETQGLDTDDYMNLVANSEIDPKSNPVEFVEYYLEPNGDDQTGYQFFKVPNAEKLIEIH